MGGQGDFLLAKRKKRQVDAATIATAAFAQPRRGEEEVRPFKTAFSASPVFLQNILKIIFSTIKNIYKHRFSLADLVFLQLDVRGLYLY